VKTLRFIVWLVLASLATALRLLSILLLVIAAPVLILVLGGRDRRFR
jgi:hypothetical protein